VQISGSSLDSQDTFIFSLKFYFLYTLVHIVPKSCIYTYTFVTFNQVARTKSTARPMTSEELAAVGRSPIRDEAHESEDIHVRESDLDNANARDLVTREEGEVGSEGEDLENVEADLRDLVTAKRSKSLPATFVFGESKVTANLIRGYEAAGYFPASHRQFSQSSNCNQFEKYCHHHPTVHQDQNKVQDLRTRKLCHLSEQSCQSKEGQPWNLKPKS
jgi:hypothetical protein